MKYLFKFKEINYGSIEVEADHLPDDSEVVDAIMNGGAYFKNTDHEDIYLIEADDGTFFFGGYHFIPHRKFRKGEVDRQAPNDSRPWKKDSQYAMRFMRSDYELCMSKYDWGKCEYSHELFYKASGGSNCDIFCYLENGNLYVPCENELFRYEKPVKHNKGECRYESGIK
jgi:hypothetical protein